MFMLLSCCPQHPSPLALAVSSGLHRGTERPLLWCVPLWPVGPVARPSPMTYLYLQLLWPVCSLREPSPSPLPHHSEGGTHSGCWRSTPAYLDNCWMASSQNVNHCHRIISLGILILEWRGMLQPIWRSCLLLPNNISFPSHGVNITKSITR